MASTEMAGGAKQRLGAPASEKPPHARQPTSEYDEYRINPVHERGREANRRRERREKPKTEYLNAYLESESVAPAQIGGICCGRNASVRAKRKRFHACQWALMIVFGGVAAALHVLEGNGPRIAGVSAYRYSLFVAAALFVFYVTTLFEAACVSYVRSSTLSWHLPWQIVVLLKSLAKSLSGVMTAILVAVFWDSIVLLGGEANTQIQRLFNLAAFFIVAQAIRNYAAAYAVFSFNLDAHLSTINRLRFRSALINDICGRHYETGASASPSGGGGSDAGGGGQSEKSGEGDAVDQEEAAAKVAAANHDVLHTLGTEHHDPTAQSSSSDEALEAGRSSTTIGFKRLLRKMRSGAGRKNPHEKSMPSVGPGASAHAGEASADVYDVGAPYPLGVSPAEHLGRNAEASVDERHDLTLKGHVNRTARLIMKRLDPDDRGHFSLEDMEALYPLSVAQAGIAVFEVIPDGRVEIDEVVTKLTQFFDERAQLQRNVQSSYQLTAAIKSFASVILYFFVLIGVFIIYDFDLERALVLTGTLLVSVSFAIGTSISNVVESFIFLVVRRPYSESDRISLEGDTDTKYTVESVTLMTTTLRDLWSGRNTQYPNFQLAKMAIHNLSRSPYAQVELKVTLPFDTRVSLIRELSEAVLSHVKRGRTAWQPGIETYVNSLDRTVGVELSIYLTHNLPLAQGRIIKVDSSASYNVIRAFLLSRHVEYTEAPQPVHLLGEGSAPARSGQKVA